MDFKVDNAEVIVNASNPAGVSMTDPKKENRVSVQPSTSPPNELNTFCACFDAAKKTTHHLFLCRQKGGHVDSRSRWCEAVLSKD